MRKSPSRSTRREILLIEDDSARPPYRNRIVPGKGQTGNRVTITLHRILPGGRRVVATEAYQLGKLPNTSKKGGKAAVALRLIDAEGRPPQRKVVAAGPTYGCNDWFLEMLAERGIDYVVEVRPGTKIRLKDHASGARVTPRRLLRNATWSTLRLPIPGSADSLSYAATHLAEVSLPGGRTGSLIAAQTGGIPGIHRGTIFALTPRRDASLRTLLRVVGWARWIRPLIRKEERQSRRLPRSQGRGEATRALNGTRVAMRSNITLARRHDDLVTWRPIDPSLQSPTSRGTLGSISRTLNIAEIFAGAGGMGLGFLWAAHGERRFRVALSAEINSVFVETLRTNHQVFRALRNGARRDDVPECTDPLDLRKPEVLSLVRRQARQVGGIHVLIGGPPCQGFSNANRNSWHSTNPNNRLIDVFLDYVEALTPPVFLLENVQGILWTAKGGRASDSLTVVAHLERRMVSAGYHVFPKLLDAVWYGVPQHRNRFFLLGLRKDLGYRREDFGQWGPFPLPTHGPGCAQPYVTVRDAISDLPHVSNGEGDIEQPYREPPASSLRHNPFLAQMRSGAKRGVATDHVTSRHAAYVIERYRRIPQGGNWQNIAETLTNYANVERTHSNIYRRLEWDEPSITIGHYRKSMLVHPQQHRGLSLREASRLQSFPDWFRFAGGAAAVGSGIVHKQQQLANAVCPLVTRALADFILHL